MKAMILAAGEGRRMRPLTLDTPKPLLQVNGISLIERHITALKAAGFDELIINIAYLGAQIKSALGDGERFGVSICYSEEGAPLETGGAIRHALPKLGEQPFLLVNADILFDYDYSQLCEIEVPDSGAHLVMIANPPHNPRGDFALNSDSEICIRSAEVKYRYPSLTFSGLSVFDPKMISQYPKLREKFPLLEVFQYAIAKRRLRGEFYRGNWSDVGTPERLAALNQ